MSTHHDFRQNASIEPRTSLWTVVLTVGTVVVAFASYGILLAY